MRKLGYIRLAGFGSLAERKYWGTLPIFTRMRQPNTNQANERRELLMKSGKSLGMTKRKRDATPATANPLPPSLDVLYKRPGFMLRRAHQISVSLFMLQQDATNITTTQYGVLVILRACEGLDQISLAKKVGLDRSTTGLVVKKLETSGYLVRIADPKDLRRKVIVLTAKGERTLESLKEAAARAKEMALSVFTPAETKNFLALLAKFVDHFNETTRAPITAE